MGITFALSRVAVNLRDTKVHVSVVNDLRKILLNNSRDDLCNGAFTTSINGVDEDIDVKNCTEELDIKVGGVEVVLDSVALAPLVLEVEAYGYSVGGENLEEED